MTNHCVSPREHVVGSPLVSMVVAIYKSELFLDKLIESIVNQTYPHLEVILVDDGSPDNSGEICDKWAAVDGRLRVIHKPNGGACDARNCGISHATGEYLVIIDGDDWLAPDYVEYLLKLIQIPGVEMSMTDSIFTTRELDQNPKDDVAVVTAEEAVALLLYPKIPVGPWNKMYSTSVLKKHGLTFCTKWSGEGLYYSTMAAQWSSAVAIGHRRIYYYRLNNSESGLTKYNVQMGLNAYENIRLIYDTLEIRTATTLNAAKCHIWRNYGFLLFLIIATGQKDRYEQEYAECVQQLRRGLLPVLLSSKVSIREKLGMVKQGLFPVHSARRKLRIETILRSNDDKTATR